MTFSRPQNTVSFQHNAPRFLDEAAPSSPMVMVTDTSLRILATDVLLAECTGYDQSDLSGVHLAQLIREDNRQNTMRAGALAEVGLRQTVAFALGRPNGTYSTLTGFVYVNMWKNRRCLIWMLKEQA